MNKTDKQTTAQGQVQNLSCWKSAVSVEPLSGGITNSNFLATDGAERYFVRIGDDIPEHGVMRFNELAASRAAAAAGISPEVIHAEPGAMVLAYVEGQTLSSEDISQPLMLQRVLPLIKRCHEQIPVYFRGPALVFWVFQVVRDYAARLVDERSPNADALPRLLQISSELEQTVGRVHLVFGHNDLLAANFIDDGQRLWLVDWDYAGFNSPLFDLGGLASNNGLNDEQENWLLENYLHATPDEELWRCYTAMKCASLLRESLWSMVSEIHSTIDFDFNAYTQENLQRFESAYQKVKQLES